VTTKKPVPIQLPDGSHAFGVDVDFETDDEGWVSYRLSDGNALRLKHTLLRVVRITDEQGNPQFRPDGQPHYMITETGHLVAREA